MEKFKDPISPKQKKSAIKPWSFAAPSYNNRSGCSIQAGDEYGSGFRQPVGKEKDGSNGPIPMKSFKMEADEVIKKDVRG